MKCLWGQDGQPYIWQINRNKAGVQELHITFTSITGSNIPILFVSGRESCDITNKYTSGITWWLQLCASGTGSIGGMLRTTVKGLVMCKSKAEKSGCLNFMTFNFSAEYWGLGGFWGYNHVFQTNLPCHSPAQDEDKHIRGCLGPEALQCQLLFLQAVTLNSGDRQESQTSGLHYDHTGGNTEKRVTHLLHLLWLACLLEWQLSYMLRNSWAGLHAVVGSRKS